MKVRSHAALISFLVFLLFFTTPTFARQQPTSYCKCVCFKNSTIIPLNSPPSSSKASSNLLRSRQGGDEAEGDGDSGTHHKQLTCSDCNRAFCLDYNLPICKNAKVDDVFTACFQRDSLKDEMVVVIFLLATTGLLGWALIKPWVSKVQGNESIQRYMPVRTSANAPPLPQATSASSGNGRRHRPAADSISRQGGLNS